ncbi:MAG: amidohydrolase family protein [Acidimicrobiia bacterium]|nr:amidohydrolase family protein [Acidimicrobiia bacterium]
MSGPFAFTIRTLDGATCELAADEHGHWAAPGDVAGAAELPSGNWWALVGLADCHAHLGGASLDGINDPAGTPDAELIARNAFAQLEAGVFLVADKGSKNDLTLRLADHPPTERPDLHAAGRVIGVPGGYYEGFAVETDEAGLADVVAAAAATSGASWVKLIGDWPRKGVGAVPSFEQDALARAVEVAHAGGCRLAIHAAAPRTSSLAVAAGVDSIEHGLFLTHDDLAALGARGGAWVPTICAMEAIADMLGPDSSGGKLFRDGLANVADLVGGAQALGVSLLCGTDLELAHGEVATEAVRLVDYGLEPSAAIDAISGAAYRYLGQDDRAFEVGRPADAVFFARDPRDDIAVLREPVFAMRHGRILLDRR